MDRLAVRKAPAGTARAENPLVWASPNELVEVVPTKSVARQPVNHCYNDEPFLC